MFLFNQTITLYNKFTDGKTGKILWHRSLLEGCNYTSVKNQISASSRQLINANTLITFSHTIVRIPANRHYMRYVLPIGFTGKANSFTLNTEDIIFKGICNYELTEENRTDFLSENKDNVFVIKSVSDNSFISQDMPPNLLKFNHAMHYKASSI